MNPPNIVIINANMGNLFSVKKACETVGLKVILSDKPEQIRSSAGIVLPGVGAFGAAMEHLSKLELIEPIRRAIKEGVPFLGICLGMQLLFSESTEFGVHTGLNIIEGKVVRFNGGSNGINFKVPHVGWNHIYCPQTQTWKETPLSSLRSEEFMYFVHSYFAKPKNEQVVLSVTKYGGVEFCSSVKKDNVFACQFHPEKSGQAGLNIYKNWKKQYFHMSSSIANG